MGSFPAFTAGDGTWLVECNGTALSVRGVAKHARTGRKEKIDSLIPLHCLTAVKLSRQSGQGYLTIRIWDGEEYDIGIEHGGAQNVIEGLQALVVEVARINVSWPMSGSRAAFARSQAPVGYLRDAYLLGAQGREEFLSPLADIPGSLGAHLWQRSALARVWPSAAITATRGGASVLLALTEDALVVVDSDAQVTSADFTDLMPPEILLDDGATLSPNSLEVALGLRVQSVGREAIELLNLPRDQIHHFFRYLLARWAENYAARFDNPVDATIEAAREMEAGDMPPTAYASVLDAIIAKASDVPLSHEFPPRERDYLRPAPASTRPATGSATPAAIRSGVPAPRQGVNPRQVAAGAAAGAALWSLFTE